jgi:hypothetical protein
MSIAAQADPLAMLGEGMSHQSCMRTLGSRKQARREVGAQHAMSFLKCRLALQTKMEPSHASSESPARRSKSKRIPIVPRELPQRRSPVDRLASGCVVHEVRVCRQEWLELLEFCDGGRQVASTELCDQSQRE